MNSAWGCQRREQKQDKTWDGFRELIHFWAEKGERTFQTKDAPQGKRKGSEYGKAPPCLMLFATGNTQRMRRGVRKAVKEDGRVRSTERSLACSEAWVVSIGTEEVHRKQRDLIQKYDLDDHMEEELEQGHVKRHLQQNQEKAKVLSVEAPRLNKKRNAQGAFKNGYGWNSDGGRPRCQRWDIL